MKIIIASKNPVKIRAALSGFEKMFPEERFDAEGVTVASGVSDQPLSDAETLQGALNRARQIVDIKPEADFWVGIEGGTHEHNDHLQVFAWIVIIGQNNLTGRGRTGTFLLPPPITELIRQGKELGEADDIVFGRTNSKQGNGAVGLLTGDIIDRTRYYTEAVVLALIPFKNIKLYQQAIKI